MLDSTVPPKPMKFMPSSKKFYFTLAHFHTNKVLNCGIYSTAHTTFHKYNKGTSIHQNRHISILQYILNLLFIDYLFIHFILE
jgi:hypothetical protein